MTALALDACEAALAERAQRVIWPFFTFYGGKWRAAPRYPAPRHRVVIEPFAGSAGYAVRHHQREVILVEKDPVIAGTWRYLINASEAEIRGLPLIGNDQAVADLGVTAAQGWLIGWWLNKGTTRPELRPGRWMRDGIRPNSQWGEVIRDRIASSLWAIRHWVVIEGDYTAAPDIAATWFIDPPYSSAASGHRYRCSNRDIDYGALAAWVHGRAGQVIACEAQGAGWLPFAPFARVKGTEGRTRSGVSPEAVWLSNGGRPRYSCCDYYPHLCPGCGRYMSHREWAEQSVCNDCQAW